jgi:Fanconi anemia group M protein
LVARKKASSLKEQQQIILEGFPGIGPKTAKKLLIKYKTIKNIMNTSLEDLQKDIGKKANIFKILDEHYLE